MATFKKLDEIECWRLARELAKEIWKELNKETLAKDWGLKDQMNRSSGSIMDNIAEGYGRGGNREFIQFLAIARGSAEELKSQLCRCTDRNHLTKERAGKLYKDTIRVSIKISNFIDYLRISDHKGQKFKKK